MIIVQWNLEYGMLPIQSVGSRTNVAGSTRANDPIEIRNSAEFSSDDPIIKGPRVDCVRIDYVTNNYSTVNNYLQCLIFVSLRLTYYFNY